MNTEINKTVELESFTPNNDLFENLSSTPQVQSNSATSITTQFNQVDSFHQSDENDTIAGRMAIDNLRHANQSISNYRVLDQIAMEKIFQPNHSLFAKLFPSKEQQLMATKRMQMVTSAADQRLLIHKIYSQYVVQDVSDSLNAQVSILKGNLRAQVTIDLKSRFDILQVSIFESQQKLISLMTEKFHLAQNIQSPSLKDKFLEEIEYEESSSLKWIRSLMDNFKNCIETTIGKYKN